ncbi:MAG: peptidoglycan DD-metalloendopeptidase family protein [Actinomycetota bacterium]|nr:peptidoglycan DD-metalloendopeptidase family protein [Actinomycetota bacterium]
MARRLVCSLVLLLLVAAPASGGVADRKHDVDDRIAALESRAAEARQREAALSAEIAEVSQKIQSLESRVGDVSSRLAALEDDLALHQRKLDALKEIYQIQSERLAYLRGQFSLAERRLADRLVAIYEGEDPSTLDVIVNAKSFSDALDQLDYVESIGSQDRAIVRHVAGARDHMHALKLKTGRLKTRVAAVTRVVAIRTAQQRNVRDRLLASQRGLSDARSDKRAGLASAREDAKEFAAEASALQAVSAQLGSQIRTAQASASSASAQPYDGTPSASGLIWPVNGPVTSTFGWRWGRMHEGIDIAAPSGTPLRAAAAGTVISAGWMGGYGNLVVIDHGGGLATAYAHLSGFAGGIGPVSQGQTIGYVGCTGTCFGDHVHFEVRVNGSAVDPLGYL